MKPAHVLMTGVVALALSLPALGAESCIELSKVVSVSSGLLSRNAIDPLPTTESIGSLVRRLGPAAREVGSGVYVVEWDMRDGRVFRVSSSTLCGKPLAAIIIRK